MRNLLASVCAAGLLVGTNLVQANEADEVYYSGQFVCSGIEYATDWTIAKALGGATAATAYFQRSGSNQVEWLDLTEQTGTTTNGLYDANGNHRLNVAAEADAIQATWMKGAPNSECSAFTVSRSESPKERFDKLFALMETPQPEEDTAEKVAEMTRFAPIVYALPEFDQQAYIQRFSELKEEFWKNYIDRVTVQLTQSPLGTVEERQAFANRLNSALSGPLRFALDRDGFTTMFATWQQAVDRYAATGASPAEELYAGNQLACQRLTIITEADSGFDFGKLELAAGVPSDYWTRDLAEDLLKGLRDCNTQAAQSYAHELPRAWSDIQKKQQLALSLRQEQSRLLALPITMATLVETKNLQPDAALAATVSTSSKMYHRFFGPTLDTRREELIKVSLASITEQSTSYSLDKPEVAKSVSEACETLQSSLPRGKRELVQQTCEVANKTIADKQTAQAIAQVDAAFASAEPGTDAAKIALTLCETLPGALSYGAQAEVYQACSRATTELNRNEEAQKCEQAIAASSASSELLENTIEVHGKSNVAIKDLICHAAKADLKITFDSSGYLMWKKQTMDLHNERGGKRETASR